MVTVLVIVTGLPLASVPVMVNTTSVPGATSVVVPVIKPVSTISTVIEPGSRSKPSLSSPGVAGSSVLPVPNLSSAVIVLPLRSITSDSTTKSPSAKFGGTSVT